jgi:hypothetical protein
MYLFLCQLEPAARILSLPAYLLITPTKIAAKIASPIVLQKLEQAKFFLDQNSQIQKSS